MSKRKKTTRKKTVRLQAPKPIDVRAADLQAPQVIKDDVLVENLCPRCGKGDYVQEVDRNSATVFFVCKRPAVCGGYRFEKPIVKKNLTPK